MKIRTVIEIGRMAALCRVAATLLALPALAQVTPTMNIAETVSEYADIDPGHPGKERLFTFTIENNSPGGNSQYHMIQFTLPGFASTNDIYGVSLDGEFADWTIQWIQNAGLHAITVHPGSGALTSDGITNNFDPFGQITFYTPFARVQTNAAQALAYGNGPGENIPFAPYPILLPDARPELVLGGATNGVLALTLTNLASGLGYRVEHALLPATNWSSALAFTATNDFQTFTLPATNAVQFYRAVLFNP
jgi:hypothetical protein